MAGVFHFEVPDKDAERPKLTKKIGDTGSKLNVHFYNMVDGSQFVLIEGYEGKHFVYNNRAQNNKKQLCMLEQEGNLRINHNNVCYAVERLIDEDKIWILKRK